MSEHNSQLFELSRGNNLSDQLKKEHAKDKSEQNVINDSDSKGKKDSSEKKSSPQIGKKFDRKCWFYENGHCRKSSCNYFHP